MKKIEEFGAKELLDVLMNVQVSRTVDAMQAVLDYIKANLDTGKPEPMSVEEIAARIQTEFTAVYGGTMSSDRAKYYAKAVQPLTVQQGFVVDERKTLSVEWPEGSKSAIIQFHGGSENLSWVQPNVRKDRPTPKMRKRTREEKIARLESVGLVTEYSMPMFTNILADSTIDDLCKAAGIDLEVRE